MKKISLLTIHLGANFGSILQTIATVVVLKKMDCVIEVVNYVPDRCTWRRFFIDTIKVPSKLIRIFISLPVVAINKHIYNSFLAKHVKVSTPIYSHDDFVGKCPLADIYMTGSDQVWNSIHNEGLDKHYYFADFPENTVKIAYSSSIGRVSLEQDEYNKVKLLLRTYKAISVREESAKKIIENMGYNVTQLVDPTFMLNKEEWKEYMSNRIVHDSYLLVYLPYNIHDKRIIYKSVRKISDKMNLKVVTFANHHILPEKMADKTIYFANPGDFLSLMYYADYVVTNSFHGTAFSIVMNKPFFVYLPNKFGTRILSILNLCSLQNRLLEADEFVSDEKMNVALDYTRVNGLLDGERKRTYMFLNDALKD